MKKIKEMIEKMLIMSTEDLKKYCRKVDIINIFSIISFIFFIKHTTFIFFSTIFIVYVLLNRHYLTVFSLVRHFYFNLFVGLVGFVSTFAEPYLSTISPFFILLYTFFFFSPLLYIQHLCFPL